MSVAALDHLFMAVPPLGRTRRPLDRLVPRHSRNEMKEPEKKTPRHPQHPPNHIEHPQPALSLRLFGLQKNGWPRTLLTALRVDIDELTPSMNTRQPVRSPACVWSSDAKVHLFFESLLLPSENNRLSPGKLAAQARPQLLSGPTKRTDAPKIQPRTGIRVDREIELVRGRHRSPGRMSTATKRPRSTSRPRDGVKKARQEQVMENQRTDLVERVEAAIEAATTEAWQVVAAQANAQLSFELMKQKTCQHIPYKDVDLAVMESASDCDDELEVLRAENAEQKALIQQLLLENRRLQAQQSPPSESPEDDLSTTSKPRRASDPVRRLSGGSSTSTSSSSSYSCDLNLSLDDEDGYVDPHFDHLVAQIESELAELLPNEAYTPSRVC